MPVGLGVCRCHIPCDRHMETGLWRQQLPPTHVWWNRPREGSQLPLEAVAVTSARDPYTVPRVPLTTCILDGDGGCPP